MRYLFIVDVTEHKTLQHLLLIDIRFNMTHPIITDLNTRYTAKKYDAEKRISAEDMEVIKEALRLSASSINSQPWKFIIIESDAAKQRFHNTFENMFQFNQPHAKEASHTILFAHDPKYTKEKFAKRADTEVSSGHLPAEMYEQFLGAYAFAEMNTDETGFNGNWTKSQVYIALGNTLHTSSSRHRFNSYGRRRRCYDRRRICRRTRRSRC